MATPVEVPKLGNSVEECVIGRWLKRPGDAVAAGDAVAEIETDKTTFEVTAPVGGKLLATFFEEGAVVPVFTNFFVVGDAGESVDAFRPQAAGVVAIAAQSAPGAAAGAGAIAAQPASSAAAGAVAIAAQPVPGEPMGAVAVAAEPALSVPAGAVATAAEPVPGASAGAVAIAAEPVPGAFAGAVRMSPRARRFAEVHDFHPASVAGSGPGGRILEEDMRKLYQARPRTTTAPRSRLRETIARRMRESLATTAQYTLNAAADAAGLRVMRARLKASAGSSEININHLVTWCAVRALGEVPSLNAEFVDGKIQEHAAVHLGFACDTPKGLLVPVVRDAHALSLPALAARMRELTAQANTGTIAADDLTGATFTVSNLGNLGIEWFTPLLNPPQVAILGVNAIQLKAVRRNGRVEFIDAIGFSLTCDHQAIDGAPGARFLQVLKAKIEGVEAECQNRF
jgi:pyruvate dehydrogenase E2 component (dihydrolipoamide acetyltransferase)